MLQRIDFFSMTTWVRFICAAFLFPFLLSLSFLSYSIIAEIGNFITTMFETSHLHFSVSTPYDIIELLNQNNEYPPAKSKQRVSTFCLCRYPTISWLSHFTRCIAPRTWARAAIIKLGEASHIGFITNLKTEACVGTLEFAFPLGQIVALGRREGIDDR